MPSNIQESCASRILKAVAILVRYVWALPNTILGLAICLLAGPRGRVSIVNGIVEAHGPVIRWALRRLVPIGGGAAAVTLGHVVLGRDDEALESARSHERVHVAQYERWGPFFLPAYFGASAWAALTGRHFYLDNVFEVEAFAEEGNPEGLPLQSGPAITSGALSAR